MIKNKYPFPQIDDLFNQLQGDNHFPKVYLRSRYHQLHIKGGNISKMAFWTWYVQYEFLTIQCCLKNAPSAFMDLMNKVFKDYFDQFVIVLIDDILISSWSKVEHEHHLRIILEAH